MSRMFRNIAHCLTGRHSRSGSIKKPSPFLGRRLRNSRRVAPFTKACIEVRICQRFLVAQHLTILLDSQNRLQPATDHVRALGAFRCVYELQLNTTLTPWNALQDIIRYMPLLRVIEMGYNRIHTLSTSQQSHTSLEELNLDSNLLSSWPEICAALRFYSS